jgi:hypothetical protein
MRHDLFNGDGGEGLTLEGSFLYCYTAIWYGSNKISSWAYTGYFLLNYVCQCTYRLTVWCHASTSSTWSGADQYFFFDGSITSIVTSAHECQMLYGSPFDNKLNAVLYFFWTILVRKKSHSLDNVLFYQHMLGKFSWSKQTSRLVDEP